MVRVREGNADIWICRLDGSELRRLTEDEARDSSPDWSPDGTRIVFSSTRSGGSDLYIRAADGSGEALRLTFLEGREDDPAWSPDGRSIAFTALALVVFDAAWRWRFRAVRAPLAQSGGKAGNS